MCQNARWAPKKLIIIFSFYLGLFIIFFFLRFLLLFLTVFTASSLSPLHFLHLLPLHFVNQFFYIALTKLCERSYWSFTVADIVTGYCVMWMSTIKGGRILADYPRVKAYLARLKARPTFAVAMGTPREWVNGPQEERTNWFSGGKDWGMINGHRHRQSTVRNNYKYYSFDNCY